MSDKLLSSGLEDYLECIYNNIQLQGGVKAVEISKELGVSRASVTDALQRLAEKKYIDYERYGKICITEKGIEKAKSVTEKHTVLKGFFEKILGLDSDEASENACRIEHVITDNAFERLKLYTTTNMEKRSD